MRSLSRSALIPITGIVLLANGCKDGTGPLPSGAGESRFSEEITYEELSERFGGGEPQRLEIRLISTSLPLEARRIEVAELEERFDEEELEVRVAGIRPETGDACGGDGVLELEIEPIEVTFTVGVTEFEDDDNDDAELTCSEFVDRVRATLDGGRLPSIEAERPPSVENGTVVPQDPTDHVFGALELELEGDDDDLEIDINVDENNFVGCGAVDSPPPDCLDALRILDAVILITSRTEIRADLEDEEDEEEFEADVADVIPDEANANLGTVELTDNTTVLIVEATEIHESGDEDALTSLSAVLDAIQAGFLVEAEGRGVPEAGDPTTITAIRIEFELEDEDASDDLD